MRASVVFVVLLAVLLCGLASAVPVLEDVAGLDLPSESVTLSRQKRDSCNMPEFLSLNTAACTTACFFKGYKSGSCILSICVCKDW